ncbi:MAG: long-chain-fatty-acid--CoA ligase [Comamonadaceae bacterium]|nr:MAG: long-chain-fatty-acid--CoA ligase [Comamonadaceae bacterium]
MFGLMQKQDLLISGLLEHAATHHGRVEIVSHVTATSVYRSSWAEVRDRSKRLANALTALGVNPGQRVATLAWNTHRHLELYFGVAGMGAVSHTVNPRLFAEQITYIINHAADEYVFFDLGFADLIAGIADQLPTVRGFVALCDRSEMPQVALPNLLCYEDLIAEASPDYEWPSFDENTASSLCYTSGTTGNPKGVLYSHRSTVLHSWTACTVDGLGLSAKDSVLLAVPMFHVNAWGIPYASAMSGAKLVLPGPNVSGDKLYALMRDEACTFSLGVPTVWLGFFNHVETNRDKLDLSEIKLARVVVGGSAAPRAIVEKFDKIFGAFVIQAWGMTETSPLATIGNLLPSQLALPKDAQYDIQARQGRAVFGVDVAIFNPEGRMMPHDGSSVGEIRVRGPWVVSAYYGDKPGAALDEAGWFSTGDVALIGTDGFVQITDRTKDVIKSGGEWISSIDLENVAVGHPKVREAAVIGVAHSKWQERPLLIIVPKPGENISAAEMTEFMKDRVARWWLPDDVVFVDDLPHTATGKLLKTKLREQFKGHRLSTDEA